jgi:hypothetical protein
MRLAVGAIEVGPRLVVTLQRALRLELGVQARAQAKTLLGQRDRGL